MPRREQNPPELRLQIRDPSVDAGAMLRNYYQIVFSLIRGGPQQPRLPLELVLCICRFASFTSSNPCKELSAQLVATLIPPPYFCGTFLMMAPPPKLETLLKTPPVASRSNGAPVIARFEIAARFLCGPGCTVSTRAYDLTHLISHL